MSFRGRGGGRGGFARGGFGRVGYGGPKAKQLPFILFPEIKDLGTAEYSTANLQLIKWSSSLQKYCNSSPYYYEDRNERSEKVQKPDIERYSDRKLQATRVKPPLWHFIKMDLDHMPAELARGEKKEKHVAKKVRWNPQSDMENLFDKLERKSQAQEGTEKKENEEEEEEEGVNEEDEGEFSDEGDYEQAEDFDDDEDDFNMDDDNNDEPFY